MNILNLFRSTKAKTPQKRNFSASALHGVIRNNLALLSPSQESVQNRNVKARARHLYNNNPVARRYVTLVQDNVVGKDGFRLQSLVSNAKGLTNTRLTRQIENAWEDFCKAGNFEASGLLSHRDVMNQILTGVLVDGEILVRLVLGRGKYGLQVQLIDSDHLYSPGNAFSILPNGNRIVQGVEVDEFSKPIRYHLYDGHPQEGRTKVVEVPAEEILHLYIPHRAGYVRGVSAFAPVIESLEMLEGYRMAELVAARMGATKGIVYETESEDAFADQETCTPRPIEPGSVQVLPPNLKMKVFDPTHPNGNFAPFTDAILKEIAAGLGVSAISLFGSYDQTSYSSMRGAFSNERSQFRMLQSFMIERFLDHVFVRWMEVNCMTSRLGLKPVGGSYEVYAEHEFKPKGFDYFNPQQEMAALVAGYESNLFSLTEILAMRGQSLEDYLLLKKQEADLFVQYGVDCSPVTDKGPKVQEDDEQGELEKENEEEITKEDKATVKDISS